MGGPSVDPTKEEASLRRSLYFTQTADIEHRFLATFDNANVLECYRRPESIVPQQALALANSPGSAANRADASRRAHQQLLRAPVFVEHAFLTLLGRAPIRSRSAGCLKVFATLAA